MVPIEPPIEFNQIKFKKNNKISVAIFEKMSTKCPQILAHFFLLLVSTDSELLETSRKHKNLIFWQNHKYLLQKVNTKI